MQILLFVFLSFFSAYSFAMTGEFCVYHISTGVTSCDSDSSVEVPVDLGTTTINTDASGATCPADTVWVFDDSGNWSCGQPKPIIIKTPSIKESQVDPNPSKDDKACNPNTPADPAHPELGCASEETAIKTNKLISESNSKLGAIANLNVTNSAYLGGILSTLKDISNQTTDGRCPPEGSQPLACSDGQVTSYHEGKFSCISSFNFCTGDDCKDTIVSACGVKKYGASDSDSLIKTEAKSFSDITPQISSSSSACPAPIVIHALNINYDLSFEPLCNFARAIRGIVITIGAFSALMIVVTAL